LSSKAERLKKIKNEYDLLKSALLSTSPFISSILRKIKIVLSSEVPTAGVNRSNMMAINPEWWETLDTTTRGWVLAHEVMHLAFRDLDRRQFRHPEGWNIIADGVNNDIQKQWMKMPNYNKDHGVTLEKIYDSFSSHFNKIGLGRHDITTLSKEELYKKIPWESVKIPGGMSGGDLMGDNKNNEKSSDGNGKCDSDENSNSINKNKSDLDGEMLQGGYESIYSNNGDDEERVWREVLAEAYQAQKQIGNMPGNLKRIVDGLLQPKVDWQSRLKQATITGMGKSVVSSYRRPSRKHKLFPGTHRFTIPTVWPLID